MIDSRSRDRKGFDFENDVMKGLDNLNIVYRGNPRDFDEWKKCKGKGADIILKDAEVECKYLTGKVYESWIHRSWLPRFNHTRRYAIIVTNFKWFISTVLRMLLYQHHIKLMDKYEFLWWVCQRQLNYHYDANKHFIVNKKGLNSWYVSYYMGQQIKTLYDYG